MTLTDRQHAVERAMIEDFFTNKVPASLGAILSSTCTETSYIAYAKRLTNSDDILPVDSQGSNSYTLHYSIGNTVIQFRLEPLDPASIQLATKLHGNLIASQTYHDDFVLPVYTTRKLPGRVHFLQKFPANCFPLKRQLNTVTQLGVILANSTVEPQPLTICKSSSVTATASADLKRLLNNESLRKLAPDLIPVIDGIYVDLPRLQLLPAVFTHNDFSELNIMVDDAGHVTGILDFEHAGYEALGTGIWGLYECFFGSMEKDKWSFYNDVADECTASVRAVLEGAFWASFWDSMSPQYRNANVISAVKVALRLGIIRRYFVKGMLDDLDMTQQVHLISLEYARGILPAV